jgi:hypothetical protein
MSDVKSSSASYKNIVEVYQTIGGAGSVNLYQVTGIVKVHYIYGIVEVEIAADVTGAFLELDDAGATVDLTLAAGPDISAAPTGSYLGKVNVTGTALSYVSAATANISEQALSPALAEFVVIQKTGGVATYIRMTNAGAGATGKIHWYCKWDKMSRDASLVAA